jgi:NADPH:quinone reductase-like Zn-dependent oxidoreductase
MEELKRRLEILLGQKPDAAIDESGKEAVEREAAALKRGERIQSAGGELLGAAFAFIGEIFSGKEDTEETLQMAESLKNGLSESLDRGEDGSLKMTITLPDETALDNIAKSLARMVSLQNK